MVAGYSGVEIFAGEISADMQSESVYHNSIWQLQSAKCAGLVAGFVQRCHRIKWRAASEDFTSTRRYERLSLEKGLIAPAKETTEKIHSLLQ